LGKEKIILLTMEDITELKRVDQSLRENEPRLKLAVEALESGIWELNVKTGTAWRSLLHDQIFGYMTLLPEWTYQMFLDHVIPEDRSEVDRKYGYALSTGTEWNFECRIRRVDQAVRWIWAHGKPSVYDDKHQVVILTGVVKDITERKKADEALVLSEERYRTSLENMQDSYIEVDLSGNLTFVNDSVCRNLGYSREELIGNNYRLTTPPDDIKPLLSAFNEVFKTGEPNKGFEHRILRKDGSIIFVESSISLRKNRSGEIIGFRSLSRDMTEHRQKEAALRESEEQFKSFMENAPDGVYMSDLEGNFLYGNRRCEEIIGYKREELIGKNFLELNLLPENSLAMAAKLLQDNIDGKSTGPDELELIRKDGFRVPVEIRTSVLQRKGQAVVLSFVRDITERKQEEKELRETGERYRLLSENTTDFVWLMDMDLKFTYHSPSVEKLTGFTPEEIKSVPLEKRITPESLKLAAEVFLKELPRVEADLDYNPVIVLDFEYLRKNGTTVWMENTFSVIRDENRRPVSILGESRDITNRRQADAVLKESEEKYRSLVENINDVFYALDNQGNITYVSPVVERFTMYKVADLIGKPFIPLVYPDDLPALLESFNRLVAGQLEPWEFRILDKDGRIIFVRTSSRSIYEGGQVVGITALMTDITERKRAEQALRQSEEKYRALVENINDVFYTLDNQGNITYVSPVIERFSKYKVSDLIGKHFSQLIYQDDLPALLDRFTRLLSGQLEPWEFRIVDKDGRIIFVRTSSRPAYENGEVVGITTLMTDITERKRMEQKLEELATHDFLTGLPNRALLADRFTLAAALANRNKARLAVMSLDLDKFKTINDTLGHAAGDQVLKTITARLTGLIRASDTVARIGGDEFILVMLETKRMEDATIIARRILDSFAEPLSIDGRQLVLSTCIGIAFYPEDAEDLETLIKKSDAAMYYSKGHGRNQFKFFSDSDVLMGGDHKSGD
jgi:diguanylate cyclase (GGDEF)-like protein/PAS domain S-box-containing protein